MGAALITNLYVDGFNLYYRALKDTPFRWTCEDWAKSSFLRTRYTGSATSRPGWTRAPAIPISPGVNSYTLRALATLPGLHAYYGAFRSGVKRRPLAEPATGLPAYVLIRDSENHASRFGERLKIGARTPSTTSPHITVQQPP